MLTDVYANTAVFAKFSQAKMHGKKFLYVLSGYPSFVYCSRSLLKKQFTPFPNALVCRNYLFFIELFTIN
ncbi:MAG: hypothetical protein A2W97_18845 [Bacteroidetes bacterium GWE2_40_63]|nr:MAG: hypothetical protein A2W84_04625 [Bacteroidetes bacterium GWC2_40_13]OFX73427.1 MAG: hypothetical protein A2W96_03940 [Bacteroidetes bacterium GWD2_40_43]OFX94777.1 MAG: hypothetical protein A2W97_18845 [Bacteroidetes bacterium GWE2_40_63]OFY24693.1 MAG: hypothetical protein A2W88_16465 [Bacteroidetes bacterium GWF2_40_13]HBX83322.1 hypothetical protein [Marinilabiliales bacterium]